MKESVITTFPSFSINSLISKRTESNIDTLPRIFPFKRHQRPTFLETVHYPCNMESRVISHATLQYTLYRRFPRNNSSDFPAERSQLESNNRNLHSMPRNKKRFVGEKVFFLEVRPVFCYWINPRPPLDTFYRPTLIEMSLENGCARVLFNRPRWFFSSFFLPSRWSFVIVPFFPRLRSRERPSRTSANYLQLEIREEEKKGSRFTFSSRFRIDFQRRLF